MVMTGKMSSMFNGVPSRRLLTMPGSRDGGYWVWPRGTRFTVRLFGWQRLPVSAVTCERALVLKATGAETGNCLPIKRLTVSWFSWLIRKVKEKPATEIELKG